MTVNSDIMSAIVFNYNFRSRAKGTNDFLFDCHQIREKERGVRVAEEEEEEEEERRHILISGYASRWSFYKLVPSDISR